MDELITLLRQASTASGRAEEQRQVTLALARFNAQPDAARHYLSLFCDQQYPAEMRGMAGLLVKNLIKKTASATVKAEPQQRQSMEEWTAAVVQVVTTPGEQPFVVSTAATILAVLMARRPDLWPSCLLRLLHAVNGQMDALVQQCLMAIERVLEEIAGSTTNNAVRYDALWSVCLALLASCGAATLTAVTILSLRIVNHLLYDENTEIDIDALLAALSRCAVNSDAEVKRLTCSCLSILSETFDAERMAPSVPAIQSFMLRALQDADMAVALEACEYWNAQADRGIDDPLVLAKLVPVLVGRVIYDEDDPDCHNLQIDNRPTATTASKPRHHRTSTDGDDDSEDDGSDTADSDYSEWTLRKCAASTIDLLSTGTDSAIFLQILLPCCQQLLDSANPLHREAAILILGAVGEGCRDGLRPYLPTLLPFIIQNAGQHAHPMVRSISAWTLGRFHWFIIADQQLLHSCMAALLEMLRSSEHVKTRRAVCSALAVFCNEAESVEFCQEWLLKVIVDVYPLFTANTLPHLRDRTTSLCNSVYVGGSNDALLALKLTTATFINTDTSNSHHDTTSLLYASMEAISGLVVSIVNGKNGDKQLIAEQSRLSYEKAINMVETCLRQCDNNDFDMDVEVAAAALDMIGAIVRACEWCDGRLISVLFACTCDSVLLQSAFAVFGDIACHCPSALSNHMEHVCQLLTDHFDPSQLTSDVASNALWAFGCICQHSPSPLPQPLLKQAVSNACRSLLLPNQSRSFYDNVVLSLGKSLMHLQDFLEIGAALPRFTKLVSVSRDDDRDIACLGMLSYLGRHAGHYLPKWPVECVRIALVPQPCEATMQVVNMVKESVVGREKWPGWRHANLPDIPLSRLE